jgi:hypothetical protein
MEYITMAAVAVAGSVFTGRSHIQAAVEAEKSLGRSLQGEFMENGFLTSSGRFVSPGIAYTLARAADQVKDKEHPTLHSEDIHPGHQFTRRK